MARTITWGDLTTADHSGKRFSVSRETERASHIGLAPDGDPTEPLVATFVTTGVMAGVDDVDGEQVPRLVHVVAIDGHGERAVELSAAAVVTLR